MEKIAIEDVIEDISLYIPIIYLDKLKDTSHDFTNINFKAIQDYLKKIGDAGEDFVFRSEISRLQQESSEYAKKVTKNPSLNHKNGYDILSFTKDGEEIYIEVKTTTDDISEPFYMSTNEYQFMKDTINCGKLYQLHRVYNYNETEKDIKVKIFNIIDNNGFFKEDILYKMTLLT